MPTVYSIKGAGIRGLLLSIPTVYSIKRAGVFLYRDFLQQVAVNRVPLLTCVYGNSDWKRCYLFHIRV